MNIFSIACALFLASIVGVARSIPTGMSVMRSVLIMNFTHDEAKPAAHFQTSLAKQRNAKLTRPESLAMSMATSDPAYFTRTIRYVRPPPNVSLSRNLT